ncbi:MAG: FhaA domain-containing protein, partial [Aggregatilineales bacterium]
FARLFNPGLSTHDIALHLVRSMEDNLQQPASDNPRFIAPDIYRIQLNNTVCQQLNERLPGLGEALSQYMTEMATQSGYRMLTTPQVYLKPDSDFTDDTIDVSASHSRSHHDRTGVLERITEQDTKLPHNPYIILNGDHNIPLEAMIVNIGRSDTNDIIVDDRHVSRHHIQLRRRNGTYILFDVRSRAGTFINNVQVREHVLQTGDVIRLGATRLTYIMDTPDDEQNAGTTAMMPPWAE